MPDVISLNQLRLNPSGVYLLENKAEDFAYSDGSVVEDYLETILQKVEDLSSTSESLQACIIDWPSEYHLSMERANLLRGFDLSKVKRVLELGSGCGAISRYLGEQGIQVDAIEGSFRRASLGRLRCRGQDNVRIINANYNALKFPEQYYDLVVFVGVIEYAHRFRDKAASDRDAALQILQESRHYLRQDGVVLVAIENRTGLKYILGAHEDHYAKRYVGINNYRGLSGIATYSETQWQSLIQDAGFKHYQTIYPFPDYKIPQVMLSKQYTLRNKYAFNHLLGIESRDYIAPHKRSLNEIMSWQAANQEGNFGAIANSFCFILGNDKNSVNDMLSFDFLHVSSKTRMLQHASMTFKPEGQDMVIKSHLVQERSSSGTEPTPLQSNLEQQNFYYGNLLQYDWLIAFVSDQGRGQFEVLVKKYYHFLLERQPQNLPLMLDMIPINIVVEKEGKYQIFDQEWPGEAEISAEYLLFRAALIFITQHWLLLEDGLAWLELKTVYGFISHVFRLNELSLPLHIDQYVTLEQQFQDSVSKSGDNNVTVDQLLQQAFEFNAQDLLFYSHCSWASEPVTEQELPGFEQHNSISIKHAINVEEQTLVFNLPPHVDQLSAIRFDPFDIRKHPSVGMYQLSRLALFEIDGDAKHLRWHLDDAEAIAKACFPESTVYAEQDNQAVWIASSDFPKMGYIIDPRSKTKADSAWRLEVDIIIAPSLYYQAISRGLMAKINHMDKDLDHLTQLSKDLSRSTEELSQLRSKHAYLITTQKAELNQLRLDYEQLSLANEQLTLAYEQKHRVLHICKRLLISFRAKILGDSKNSRTIADSKTH